MRVNLIDIDQKQPNLALMKLSAHWKARGAEVTLNAARADKHYLSCVFRENRRRAKSYISFFNAEFGGFALNEKWLPEEIEHICPDYDLYGIDYSMGFTTRGCIKRCDFCIVPQKEGELREWANLDEFVRHKRVKILDNNFLASERCLDKLGEMIDRKLIVDFNQGLDAFFIRGEKARLLSKLNPPYIRISFDNIGHESTIQSALLQLEFFGFPVNRNRVGCYVLVGYDSTIEEDLYRIKFLHERDINTHIQVYNNRRDDPMLRHLSRWGNRVWLWKSCSFEEYVRGISVKYHLQKRRVPQGGIRGLSDPDT